MKEANVFFHFFMEQQLLRETECIATSYCQEYIKHRGIKDIWVYSTFREKCGIEKIQHFPKYHSLRFTLVFKLNSWWSLQVLAFLNREIYFLNYFRSSVKQIINFKRAMVFVPYKPNLLLCAILSLQSCTDCKEVCILQCRTNICNWAFNLQGLGTYDFQKWSKKTKICQTSVVH